MENINNNLPLENNSEITQHDLDDLDKLIKELSLPIIRTTIKIPDQNKLNDKDTDVLPIVNNPTIESNKQIEWSMDELLKYLDTKQCYTCEYCQKVFNVSDTYNVHLIECKENYDKLIEQNKPLVNQSKQSEQYKQSEQREQHKQSEQTELIDQEISVDTTDNYITNPLYAKKYISTINYFGLTNYICSSCDILLHKNEYIDHQCKMANIMMKEKYDKQLEEQLDEKTDNHIYGKQLYEDEDGDNDEEDNDVEIINEPTVKLPTDRIPTEYNGQYQCKLCHKRYIDMYYLGEHFALSHTNYSELCQLDDKQIGTQYDGFPGFKLLKHIGMINNLSHVDKQLIKKNKLLNHCQICFFDYYREENNKRIPIELSCCKNILCKNCFRDHISISNTIICPYCKKDHTVENVKYISLIEMDELTDRQKWISWWENHMEIFELSFNKK